MIPLSFPFPSKKAVKKNAKTHPKTSPGRGTKGATRRCSGRGDNNTPGKAIFSWLKTVSTEVGLNEKVANLLTDGFSTSKAEDWSFGGFDIFVGDME